MSYAYQSEGVVSEEEGTCMFLAHHLPSDTPVYHYDKRCTIESLSPQDSVEDCFVVLKDLPSETLAKLDEQLNGRCDYSPSLQIVTITMPSHPHEEAASSLDIMIGVLAKETKVYRRISNCGSTTIETPDRSKQADRSWEPARLQRKLPTVALEVGFSKATAKLERDIAWWINESKGEVKLGLTINIKRSGSIEIKSWTPAFMPLPSHVHITAHGRPVVDRCISDPPPPRMAQRICITTGRDHDNPTIGGDLIIPFHALMLEQPGESEHDFVLTTEPLLQDLAERVWLAIDEASTIMVKNSNTL